MFLKSLATVLFAASLAACGGSTGRAAVTPVEGDAAIGPADAKVTLVEYGSPTCPACKSWHDQFWPEVKRDYVDTGKIKFVFREFAIHGAIDAGIFAVARCAGPNDFYAVLDEAFVRQQDLTRAGMQGSALPELTALGGKFNLSADQVKTCLNDPAIIRRINDVRSDASGKGIDSTPSFVLNGTVLATNDWNQIKPMIDTVLTGGAVPAQADDGHGH